MVEETDYILLKPFCAVVLGLRETEEMYYFLVKETKTLREASINCKLRGGILAMPKTSTSNHLMAEYVNQAGLTGVYVGVVQAPNKTMVSHVQQQGAMLPPSVM